MEKSSVPTSRFQVFCDTFDMKGEAKIHKVNGDQKIELSLTSEDGEKKQSLSLYKEDAEMLAAFLASAATHLDKR